MQIFGKQCRRSAAAEQQQQQLRQHNMVTVCVFACSLTVDYDELRRIQKGYISIEGDFQGKLEVQGQIIHGIIYNLF